MGERYEILRGQALRKGSAKEQRQENRTKKEGSWFDEECKDARKEMREKNKKWKRDNDETSKEDYLEAKRKYREIVKVKKEIFNEKQSEEINNLLKNNDTRGIWNYVNKVGGKEK